MSSSLYNVFINTADYISKKKKNNFHEIPLITHWYYLQFPINMKVNFVLFFETTVR